MRFYRNSRNQSDRVQSTWKLKGEEEKKATRKPERAPAHKNQICNFLRWEITGSGKDVVCTRPPCLLWTTVAISAGAFIVVVVLHAMQQRILDFPIV